MSGFSNPSTVTINRVLGHVFRRPYLAVSPETSFLQLGTFLVTGYQINVDGLINVYWLFFSHFGLSNKYLLISLLSLTFSMIIPSTFMISNGENATVTESSQTNINANSLYNNRTMILGNNVKNFVIIIPDEAHESLKNQLPLTNQPYLPQHLVTNVGTTIVWFNADVGHKHMITLTDSNSKKVYQLLFFHRMKLLNL